MALKNQALAISPSMVVQGSTSTINLAGTLTNWTRKRRPPSFVVSTGTKSNQVITSARAGSFNYTAPDSPGLVTITDPSTGKTAILTVATPSPGKTST